jgi:hypothetical protein
MAKRKKTSAVDVPAYEGIHRKRNISPGPKSFIDAKVIDDKPVRRTRPVSAPAARSSSSAPSTRKDPDPAVAERARRLAAEGHEYATRQAIRATSGKPSVTGRAASGAAAGAATGAALGTVVPGVGNAVGAGAGAVLGGAGGALSGARAKKAYKQATRMHTPARRIIVIEFAICIVVAALSPLTDRKREEPPAAWMKRMTALMGLFFILGLLSAGGRGLAKLAAGFGGLVTVGLVVSERNLFVKLAQLVGKPAGAAVGDAAGGALDGAAGGAVGGAVGGAAGGAVGAAAGGV